MKRFVAFLLILCMFPCLPVLAEEAGNGEVIEIDLSEYADAEAVFENSEPYIPENIEKMVIDYDDRRLVEDPTRFPFSAIAYMEVTGECGCRWTGSGFMAARDILLTAGHCLYCTDHLSWANQITFYYGYRNGKNYYHRYNGRWTAWTSTDIINGKTTPSSDYGIVKFRNTPPGDTTGWFGMCALSDHELQTYYLTVAGYRHKVLKSDYGFILDLGSRWIHHDADTEPGYSGCPIFIDYNLGDYAVGINTSHNTYAEYNAGFRFDSSFLNFYRDVRDNK